MDMYRENIMDHYKNPRNYGMIDDPDIKHEGSNLLCGDEITITMKLGGSRIKSIKFSGKGCAISQASASMLTEELKDKKIEEIGKMNRDDMLAILGISLTPVRVKCAVLAMKVVQDGLRLYNDKVAGTIKK